MTTPDDLRECQAYCDRLKAEVVALDGQLRERDALHAERLAVLLQAETENTALRLRLASRMDLTADEAQELVLLVAVAVEMEGDLETDPERTALLEGLERKLFDVLKALTVGQG